MPREVITVSVGQAGNQLGHRFWELAVQEHAAHDASGRFPDAMCAAEGCRLGGGWCRLRRALTPGSSTPRAAWPPCCRAPLFRNVDAGGADLPLSRGRGPLDRQPLPIEGLRARAVLVDMVR